MQSDKGAVGSNKRLWTGRILSGVAVLLLLFDSITKLMKVAAVVQGLGQVGYPLSLITVIGTILLVCVIIYLIPRTAPIGAILLTGYLGGAVATNLRVGNPLFTDVLAPVYVAAVVWGGLYLRDIRVRALIVPTAS